MPFPKTWVEELIIEWLHLKGFLVEANLPVSTTKAGGRLEVDVVGAKLVGTTLEIIHVETGQLSGGTEGIKAIGKKFSSVVYYSLLNYFSQKLSSGGYRVNYKKVYIATYWTKPTIDQLRGLGIDVRTLPDFICNEVLPSIDKWKQNPPHHPKGRATLPESFWLLQLLDSLKDKGMLKCT